MPKRTKSLAKQQMIKFIQETKENPVFKLKLRGNQEDAEKFVHRMRVELSRMRDIVKQQGRVPKEFKVMTDEIFHDKVENITTVKLRKVEGKDIQIADDLDDIFDDLAGGVRIQ